MSQNTANKYNFEPLQSPEVNLPLPAPKQERWSQLDMARGIAITLMILSHSVKGLLAQSMIPNWGLVPIHLLTKLSSSLFILVFGFGLSLYFIPHVNTANWRKKRSWMIMRGIELMFWYKILTVVQMFQFYPQATIFDTLWFKRMPDFVEILSFYSIALIWLPFALPAWAKSNYIKKIVAIIGLFSIGQWLHYNFDFFGIAPLKAILVEEKGFFTFGQFQRGALIFLGLFIGDIYKKLKSKKELLNVLPMACAIIGSSLLSTFYMMNEGSFMKAVHNIADNVGKHPFDINFLCFSLGGALLILGICLLSNIKFQKWMTPISYLGRYSLNAFILHIFIIFYFYRYSFGLHRSVTYPQSLGLALACVASVVVILYAWNKFKEAIK